MRKIFYISLLLFGLFSAAQAQKKIIYQDSSLLQKQEELIEAPTEGINIDSPIVRVMEETTADEPADTSLQLNGLYFSFDSIKYWRNSKDYAYAKNLDSLLKNRKKKAVEQPQQKQDKSFFADLLNSGILQMLLWAAAICFVLFILYRLFLADGVFSRKSKAAKKNEAEVAEEIITHESDFDGLIRQALQNGNYRQAVRYQYLRTLHLLAARGTVSLAPDKTNFNYVTEITNADHRNAFAALTLNYEYAWYGGFEVGKNIYEKIEHNFSSLNKKI